MAIANSIAPILSAKQIDFFWSKVQKKGPNDCWLWKHCICRGYGRIMFNYRHMIAHRVAYFLEKGVWPAELFTCHTCDVPLCCNPSHLFLGTRDDNMADMANKGRSPRGEKHHNVKLTKIQVHEIKSLCNKGYVQRYVAELFGVKRKTISDIITGKTWRH